MSPRHSDQISQRSQGPWVTNNSSGISRSRIYEQRQGHRQWQRQWQKQRQITVQEEEDRWTILSLPSPPLILCQCNTAVDTSLYTKLKNMCILYIISRLAYPFRYIADMQYVPSVYNIHFTYCWHDLNSVNSTKGVHLQYFMICVVSGEHVICTIVHSWL